MTKIVARKLLNTLWDYFRSTSKDPSTRHDINDTFQQLDELLESF